jgi:uncharacterized membrane protein YdbT with pleckstrin-like domain
MSYIEKNLMAGEDIIYRAKLHWVVFLWPIFWFSTAIPFYSINTTVGSLFIVIAIITGITSFINYLTSEFGVTDKRVIVKVGFIRRNSLEVLLTKIEGIQVNQGILGRIRGVTIIGTKTYAKASSSVPSILSGRSFPLAMGSAKAKE